MPLNASSTCRTCGRVLVEDVDEDHRSVFECPLCVDVFFHEACSSTCPDCGHDEPRQVAGGVLALREGRSREHKKEKKGRERREGEEGTGKPTMTAAERRRLEAVAHVSPLPEDDGDFGFTLGTVDSEDSANEFGAFDRSFRWVPPAHATGHIVQRIDRTEQVNRDDGMLDTALSSTARYWEAWPVVDGLVRAADGETVLAIGAHDSWVAGDLPACRGRHGRWEIIGTVHWLPEGTPLPASFRLGAVPAASAYLLATEQDPQLVGESLMVHSRSKSWDAPTLAAACQLLSRWEADSVLTDGLAETERVLIQDYRFGPAIARAAVQWGVEQGFRFEPEVFTDDEGDPGSGGEDEDAGPGDRGAQSTSGTSTAATGSSTTTRDTSPD